MPYSALGDAHPLHRSATGESALLRALRGERPEHPPVWFMRQAGRSLPEYRELRIGTDMLDACLDPAMSSEITLQPVRRHGVDAGIFFSDIVVPIKLAGVDVTIEPGRGPVFAERITTAAQVAALPDPETADFSAVAEGVRRTVAELGSTPLIGFAGAPFTLAAYLTAGGPSKDQLPARTLMHGDPEAWEALLTWTARLTGAFLRAQILAGASAAQLFDSWAGSLGVADYSRFVARYSALALEPVRDLGVPVIHFGVGTAELLPAMRSIGVDALGVDWRLPLDEAARRVGQDVTLQGNIDPALLGAPWPAIEAHVREVVERGRAARAHVVNLGHGVPPETDPTVLTRIVELVHSL
jgi:uroporphyrinogen decarboxylase